MDYLDKFRLPVDLLPTELIVLALVSGGLLHWLGKGCPLPFRSFFKKWLSFRRDA